MYLYLLLVSYDENNKVQNLLLLYKYYFSYITYVLCMPNMNRLNSSLLLAIRMRYHIFKVDYGYMM